MLRLEKIRISNGTVEADYFPESSKMPGHVVVDMGTEEIITATYVDGYGASYVGHAAAKLTSLSEMDTIPSECVVMWY